jgi:hypothetical protein
MTTPNSPEPSVLDYLKGRLFPRINPKIAIPDSLEESIESSTPEITSDGYPKMAGNRRNFWNLLCIISLVVIGQRLLEPPNRSETIALVFYACALMLVFWNWYKGSFRVDFIQYVDEGVEIQPFRHKFLIFSIAFGVIAFLLFKGSKFTQFNVVFWILSAVALIITFFDFKWWRNYPAAVVRALRILVRDGLRITTSPWGIVLGFSFILVVFFRFYRLNEVPIEMISDQAEKLLDINDVLAGNFWTFFPRNTGREAFQMYLSAAVAIIFGTGISFLTLKIGTAILGVFTAVYMYFLGKEMGNRWVGLFAFILCGIGYWPNVISRIGLRFTLYAAFTAPALYYFLKGIRRKRWSDLVLAGIFTGIGLQGYSPFRVIPVLLFIGVVLYLLHSKIQQNQKFVVLGLVIAGFAALVFFLPLARYILDQPEMFAYRALTRAGSLERPLPGPAGEIFLNNFWQAITMPFYQNGTIWVHSVPLRPALDIVSAAFLLIGLVVCIFRYIHQRDWRIPFIIFSVPFLMLPSILSLAFPDENPCLNRTSGALVPIFLISALGLEAILKNLRGGGAGWHGRIQAGIVGGALLVVSMTQNYDLVFRQYDKNYINNSLNTSQIGKVIRDFADLYGDPNSAYVVGYPYWVDTRLVGMNAGYPTKDYAIWGDQFPETVDNKRAKLFILNPEDTRDLDALRNLYPDYYETEYKGWVPSKNFIVFLVPPGVNSVEEIEPIGP